MKVAGGLVPISGGEGGGGLGEIPGARPLMTALHSLVKIWQNRQEAY